MLGIYVVVEPTVKIFGKRKVIGKQDDSNAKRIKQHGSFYVAELAHVVALCDERLPFALLTNEVYNLSH